MLKLFVLSIALGFMVGYPIGRYFIAPYIAMKHIKTLKNEIFVYNLGRLAREGKGLTPER